MEYLRGLNPQQLEAVKYNEGPMLLLAGAGAGKTKTLISKIAYLIHKEGYDPHNILAVTFTNKAAQEMRHRLGQYLDYNKSRAVQAGTFHSLCARLLRLHAPLVGLKNSFTIYDESESFALLKRILEQAEVNKEEVNAGAVSAFIDELKNKGHYRQQDPGKLAENKFYPFFQSYEKALEENNAVDFNSLITKMIQLLENHKEVQEMYHNHFRYILVDEYQDTNVAQLKLIRLLLNKDNKLCCIGDGDQCLVEGTLVSTPDGLIPIEQIKEGDLVFSAVKKEKKKAVPVSKVFKKKVNLEVVEITTNTGKKIISTKEHVHFAEFNKDHSPATFMSYLMFKKNVGFRIGISQIYETAKGKTGRLGFTRRLISEQADKIWILKNFKTEPEARYFETLMSLKYQIPTVMFNHRKSYKKDFKKTLNQGVGNSQFLIDNLFKEINTFSSGKKLLKDFNLLFEYSHFNASSASGDKTKKLTISLLAGPAGPQSSTHRLYYFDFDEERKKILEEVVSTRGHKGVDKWRVDKQLANLKDLYKLYHSIDRKIDVNLEETIALKKNSINLTRATNVRPGMVVINENFEYEVVVDVKFRQYKGFVYDLNIDRYHNFVANGLFTHNSIYSWRGAEIKNVMEFQSYFPGAKDFKLEENYRSTKNIVDAATEVIKKNLYRKDKTMFTKSEEGGKINVYQCEDGKKEAQFIAQEIQKLLRQKVSPKEIAVFYRNNSQSRAPEEAFRMARIPYELIGGQKFYDRKEIKDLLAYMRLLVNSEDNGSLIRIINTPSRGIGEKALETLLTASRNSGKSLFNFILDGEFSSVKISAKTKDALDSLKRLYERAMGINGEGSLLALYEHFLEGSGYEGYLKGSKKVEDAARLDNLREFKSSLKGLNIPLIEFLESLTLNQEQEDASKDDRIKLMTIHASKGLEFDYVFILGLEEGIFPTPQALGRDLEEERRLFYVAMTRAKKELNMFHAQSRLMYGQFNSNPKSRFLYEVPSKYCRFFRI